MPGVEQKTDQQTAKKGRTAVIRVWRCDVVHCNLNLPQTEERSPMLSKKLFLQSTCLQIVCLVSRDEDEVTCLN